MSCHLGWGCKRCISISIITRQAAPGAHISHLRRCTLAVRSLLCRASESSRLQALQQIGGAQGYSDCCVVGVQGSMRTLLGWLTMKPATLAGVCSAWPSWGTGGAGSCNCSRFNPFTFMPASSCSEACFFNTDQFRGQKSPTGVHVWYLYFAAAVNVGLQMRAWLSWGTGGAGIYAPNGCTYVLQLPYMPICL